MTLPAGPHTRTCTCLTGQVAYWTSLLFRPWTYKHIWQTQRMWSNSICSIFCGFVLQIETMEFEHHSPRVSLSRLLIATGLVSEDYQFLTPAELTSFNRSPKNWHGGFNSRPPPKYQIWCKSVPGGLVGKWVKCNQSFYSCPFWELTYLSDEPTDFNTWWLKKRQIKKQQKSKRDITQHHIEIFLIRGC